LSGESLPLNISKNQRLAIFVAFIVGGDALYLLLREFYTSYVSYAVCIIYYFVCFWFLTRIGGCTQEKAYSFPYPKERVSETVPTVMEEYDVWKKRILCSDSESGQFSFQFRTRPFDWWRAPSVLAVDVSRLDDKSCAVKVRCEMKQFFDWNAGNYIVDAFFNRLNARLAEATAIEEGNLPKAGYRPLECLSKYEQTVGTLLLLGGLFIIFAGLGSFSAPQYSLKLGVTPIDSIVLVLFGVMVVLIALLWFVVKTRAWELFRAQPQNEAH